MGSDSIFRDEKMSEKGSQEKGGKRMSGEEGMPKEEGSVGAKMTMAVLSGAFAMKGLDGETFVKDIRALEGGMMRVTLELSQQDAQLYAAANVRIATDNFLTPKKYLDRIKDTSSE